jgi:hypothetical protein
MPGLSCSMCRTDMTYKAYSFNVIIGVDIDWPTERETGYEEKP